MCVFVVCVVSAYTCHSVSMEDGGQFAGIGSNSGCQAWPKASLSTEPSPGPTLRCCKIGPGISRAYHRPTSRAWRPSA